MGRILDETSLLGVKDYVDGKLLTKQNLLYRHLYCIPTEYGGEVKHLVFEFYSVNANPLTLQQFYNRYINYSSSTNETFVFPCNGAVESQAGGVDTGVTRFLIYPYGSNLFVRAWTAVDDMVSAYIYGQNFDFTQATPVEPVS